MRGWLKSTVTLLLIGSVVMAGSAFAAKGGKPSSKDTDAAIVLDQSDPHLYDWITFTLRTRRTDPIGSLIR